MIVAVIGLPGSGKSYFAERLARAIHGIYINSDRLRKELFAKPEYTPEEKVRVYQVMLQKMREALEQGRNAVLDATFHLKQSRDLIAAEAGAKVHFIEIRAHEAVISKRLKKIRPWSDADFAVYQLIKKEWEPMAEEHLILESTEDNIEFMLKQALQYLHYEARTD